MKKVYLLILFCCLSSQTALALQFEDKDLEPGKVINLSEILEQAEMHFDTVYTSDWTAARAGASNNIYRSFFDYRIEGHLPIYNLAGNRGRLITRVQGLGPLDKNIGQFVEDPLIDIPELFWQNDKRVGDNDLRFVFGKFANRRFFNKDEINSDPFDIGEMRFSGQIANTLDLLSGINQFRDADLRAYGSRQANGSYGFNLGVKNQNRDGKFLSRWGFEQAFAVSQLDDFKSNFYGISELNKDWGETKPGRLRLGFLYANDGVFRLANNDENSYLVYSSIAQKVTSKLKVYARYGTLFRNLNSGASNDHEFKVGFYRKWTDKISSHHWLGYFNNDASLGEEDNRFHQVNSFTYRFTDNFLFNLATVFRFNQGNSAASNGSDNNFTIATQLRFFM